MNAFLDGVLARLRETFEPRALGAALVDLVGNLLVGVITFLVFYLVWWVLDRGLRHTLQRARTDPTTASFTQTAVKYGLLIVGALQAFKAVGIDTAAFLASLGIAGLTIGFAARDSLSNLISGILIFWDRPFVIGDLVEVGGHYGRVDHITLRSTRVVTNDGRMLAVPNSTIINSTVASYTNFPNLRLDIEVSVGVTENLDRVRSILLDQVRSAPGFLSEPEPRVVVKALNDYNVVVELQAWIKNEREHIGMRFALRERIFLALRSAQVDMPFETLQLAPIEVRAQPAPIVSR